MPQKKENKVNKNKKEFGQAVQEDIDREDNDIKIYREESSLAQFVKRPVPSQKELEDFEEYIEEEAKEEEIEESLNEIYNDRKNGPIDVSRLEIKKRRGFLFWFFSFIFMLGIIGAAGYGVYYYIFMNEGLYEKDVEFFFEPKEPVLAGEDFFYTLAYHNKSRVAIRNIRIEINYPDNFVFLDSFPESLRNNSVWLISEIPVNSRGEIKIKGKLLGQEKTTGIVIANMTYTPENFSSEFRKEASITTAIKDIGLRLNIESLSRSLVGDINDLLIKFSAKEVNYLKSFRVTIEPQENIEFITNKKWNFENLADFTLLRPGVLEINEVLSEEMILPVAFRFTEKIQDEQEINILFEQIDHNNKFYNFYREKITYEVMKSDLNLTLIINGTKENKGVNFGETLNYSIVYNNQGETPMKEAVIMAVLESEFLSWASLKDDLNGRERGNTLTWTKQEIPQLELIEKNQEGIIDFSIAVLQVGDIDPSKNYQIRSYAQYSIGNVDEVGENQDSKSNTIVNRINSDLSLSEQVRYYTMDNIPVGTGPNPPKVGQTTTYKVYWDITNKLHELQDLTIKTVLPEYISWHGKNFASVGTIEYNSEDNEVIWNVGRLPVTAFKSSAEFSISLTPEEGDRNKIMVLLSGATISATDTETKEFLERKTKAKTSKLEDDKIAGGDGIVE